uniref:Uncharacterized protein n=1 Tax=Lotharella globosa TaxID=91324 RepID=A0A7S4DWC2_9EUKA|mmetsp:Transcript_4551/g.8151  ORF Transcript_4551/g.8151 Transcript_4551/m.8151 type:complete len:222 (+) Transcript_4551:34-699(+)
MSQTRTNSTKAPWERSNGEFSAGKRMNIRPSTSVAPWAHGDEKLRTSRRMVKPTIHAPKSVGKKMFKAHKPAEKSYVRGKKLIQPKSFPKKETTIRRKKVLASAHKENFNMFNKSASNIDSTKPRKKIIKSACSMSHLDTNVVPKQQEQHRGKKISVRKSASHLKNMTPVTSRPSTRRGLVQDHNKIDHLRDAPNSGKKPSNASKAAFQRSLRPSVRNLMR